MDSLKKKKKKRSCRVTRRCADIFSILTDTVLMCDSEGQMGKAEGEINVMQQEVGIEKRVIGRVWDERTEFLDVTFNGKVLWVVRGTYTWPGSSG